MEAENETPLNVPKLVHFSGELESSPLPNQVLQLPLLPAESVNVQLNVEDVVPVGLLQLTVSLLVVDADDFVPLVIEFGVPTPEKLLKAVHL